MTWNYRVVKRRFTYPGGFQELTETLFHIHEVYYDDDGKPCSTTMEPVVPSGDTPEELANSLKRFIQALNQPILDYDDDFPDNKGEEKELEDLINEVENS